jgi:hypothetical protein
MVRMGGSETRTSGIAGKPVRVIVVGQEAMGARFGSRN